jgi:hypothetical protein
MYTDLFITGAIKDTGNNARLDVTGSALTSVVGAATNGGSAFGVKVGNINTLSTAGASIQGFYSDNLSTLKGRVDNNGFYIQSAQTTITVADDGAGTKPTSTLTPTGIVTYACNDATGTTVTVSETGAQTNSRVIILNTGTGNCEFADTSGVTELSGAFVMGPTDTLELIYMNSAWHELRRSDN